MNTTPWMSPLSRKPKINRMYDVRFSSAPKQKVFWLDVTVNEATRMNILDSSELWVVVLDWSIHRSKMNSPSRGLDVRLSSN